MKKSDKEKKEEEEKGKGHYRTLEQTCYIQKLKRGEKLSSEGRMLHYNDDDDDDDRGLLALALREIECVRFVLIPIFMTLIHSALIVSGE